MSNLDPFDDIIKNGDFEEVEEKTRDLMVVSVKSMHETIALLTQTASSLTHFIIDYFEAISDGVDPPALSEDAAIAVAAMTSAANNFCDEVTYYLDDDEDDDDDDDEVD